jgi:hypothetical protein
MAGGGKELAAGDRRIRRLAAAFLVEDGGDLLLAGRGRREAARLT